jgi:predicted ATPase
MPISDEVRRLSSKWSSGSGWPKRLEWIEIDGLRGWTGQRFTLNFPIMAVVGENGVGKSTVLQCAAAVYREPTLPKTAKKKGRFASDFFPDTAWEMVKAATIRYAVREGGRPHEDSIRKPGERWRGNPQRRERPIEYIDLSRIQPVSARTGYSKLAKPTHKEISSEEFDKTRLARFSEIMGRAYDVAKMALTDGDAKRSVPVLRSQDATYSGFHQGAGETTIAELLEADLPQYGIILIDEIETSLHPRSQRRLIRDLAAKCRERELQVVLTTHSPYILDELPLDARAYIMQPSTGRSIVYGVSPEFAMSKMDDVPQFECDLYVEDRRAETFLVEILAAHAPQLVQRCRVIPYGAASVGMALGQMKNRFPRPSCVFLDGDQSPALRCIVLPGEDAPERVVFGALKGKNWLKIADRTGRQFADVADACSAAMALGDHHDWVRYAATRLTLGGDTLWQAMCADWASNCLDPAEAQRVTQPIEDSLISAGSPSPTFPPPMAPKEAPSEQVPPPGGKLPLFDE